MSFYTVREMSMRYPAFSQGSFRWLIFNEHTNGFHKCVVRPQGIRKVLIDELEFLKWLKANPKQNFEIDDNSLEPKLNNKPKKYNNTNLPPSNIEEEEEEPKLL